MQIITTHTAFYPIGRQYRIHAGIIVLRQENRQIIINEISHFPDHILIHFREYIRDVFGTGLSQQAILQQIARLDQPIGRNRTGNSVGRR